MKLITFDFWNTLFVDVGEDVRQVKRREYAMRTFQRHKPGLEVQHLEDAFRAGNDAFSRQWSEKRSSSMFIFVTEMIRHLAVDVPSEDSNDVVGFFERILLEHPPALIPNAGEAVRFAAARAKVGLICDTGYSPGTTLRRLLEMHDLHSCFHEYSFSNETGYLKPSPQCFLRILQAMNVKPEEAVHIGDLEDTDIAGAKSMGMKAIKYIGTNPEATRESVADAVIENLSELPDALSKVFG